MGTDKSWDEITVGECDECPFGHQTGRMWCWLNNDINDIDDDEMDQGGKLPSRCPLRKLEGVRVKGRQ